MQLEKVLIRFTSRFNYDYLRKNNPSVTDRHEWEFVDDAWYPFVEIPVEQKTTTIVGENESGKSHLLSAIEKGSRAPD